MQQAYQQEQEHAVNSPLGFGPTSQAPSMQQPQFLQLQFVPGKLAPEVLSSDCGDWLWSW